MIGQYVKKPVTICAMQWDGSKEVGWDIVFWARGGDGNGETNPTPVVIGWDGNKHFMEIPTLEGLMSVSPGDYVIKEPFPTDDRKFYPCKPDIFASTYEDAEDANDRIEDAKEEAWQRGYDEGHRDGHDRGFEEGLDDARARI